MMPQTAFCAVTALSDQTFDFFLVDNKMGESLILGGVDTLQP